MRDKNKKNGKFINEELIASGRLSFADSERTFVITEEVKAFISEVFDNFDLKTDSRKLLDALLEISNGRIRFKATRQDIVYYFRFPNKNVKNHTKTDRIWDASKELKRWSQNNTEFIKVLEDRGMGRDKVKKHLTSSEAVYEFVLLKKLKQFILEDTRHNRITTTNLKKFVSRLKGGNRRRAFNSPSSTIFIEVS